MDLGLQGRVAIVTGAGRHIGRQIALTLAQEGAKVAIDDYFADRAEAVAEEIRAAGGESIGIKADVVNMNEVNEMVKTVLDRFGRVDILVNNAGVPAPLPGEDEAAAGAGVTTFFAETSKEMWDRFINVNLYGVLNCSRATIQHMIDQKFGKVVSIISEAGRVGEPRMTAYAAAKAGIVGFSKSLAREVGRFCINVNCVAVGATPQEALWRQMGVSSEEAQERIQAMMRVYPLARGMERLGLPSDIANAVAFLASDAAPWITGQVLSVSGGFTMVG